jgi:glycosyltransferase involved in cell wall biosynthesis
MTGPGLTVVIPVRHYHRPYLERAIGSILAQSSGCWRLLVVRDGELDPAFLQVVAEPERDVRVTVTRSDGDGLAAALNTAFRRAETEFVAILLGDDMWAPQAVEVLAGSIEQFPEVDFFHSSRRFIDGDDEAISSVYPARESFTVEDFVQGSPVRHLMCVRRSVALAIGGVDETLAPVGPDDYDFPWSLAESGATFRAVPDCLYLMRDHRDAERLTTHLPRSVHVRALRHMMRKHGVGLVERERKIAHAKRTYLRQCLYRSHLDRWVKERTGFDPQQGWREPLR